MSAHDVLVVGAGLAGMRAAVEAHEAGVDAKLLDPRSTWRDPEAYDRKARELAGLFHANFETFAADAPPEVTAAGPSV